MKDAIEQYLPWFILKNIPSLGNQAAKDLIDTYKDPETILALSPRELKQVKGLSFHTINALTHYESHVEKARAQLVALLEHSMGILTLNDPAYPALLRQIPDPPLLLTCAGDILPGKQDAACIAIVGSRTPTDYGLKAARAFSSALGKAGFVIVSGMARGIDSAAHQGALEAGATTVAVLGSGLGNVYPPENKDLFNEIQKNGAILSEFPLDAPPLGAHFPVRNRIIAGMTLGTLVIEAAKKSGSLITARLACEYNREVFAMPGSIYSAKSTGTHELLKNGATLIENHKDVIEQLQGLIRRDIPEPKDKKEQEIHSVSMDKDTAVIDEIIGPYPVHIDRIIEKSAMHSARVNAILLELELSGRITKHPGNYFSRTTATG
ncbi:MAG: DNA-protecting protein DprA [Desulfobacterales bacterium]|nr:MAG: DNA-protecting protein DprA [Desulfobacterales bacterium]